MAVACELTSPRRSPPTTDSVSVHPEISTRRNRKKQNCSIIIRPNKVNKNTLSPPASPTFPRVRAHPLPGSFFNTAERHFQFLTKLRLEVNVGDELRPRFISRCLFPGSGMRWIFFQNLYPPCDSCSVSILLCESESHRLRRTGTFKLTCSDEHTTCRCLVLSVREGACSSWSSRPNPGQDPGLARRALHGNVCRLKPEKKIRSLY